MKSSKQLLLFIFLTLFFCMEGNSQDKSYEARWKQVNDLIEKKNLPKDALAEVRKIYALAKKEKQDAQVIKALIYISNLQQQNREDNAAASIKDFEKELAGSTGTTAALLRSILADLYWRFFQNNRYKFYDRTGNEAIDKNDINTWTAEDLHKIISALYLASIHGNEAQLKQTRVEQYEPIINKGNMRYLRPTLFDLLAHQALSYFQNDERDIAKPTYAFEINSDAAFAPAGAFITHRFTTKDSLSLQHKALLIYQDLLAFHLRDEKKDALIDADIQRLEFVHGKSVSDNKDSLYLAALEHLYEQYPKNPQTKQARFLIASWYEEEAQSYKPLKDTASRYQRIKAKALLEEIVRDSSVKNEGWTNAFNLLQQVNKPALSFELEKVNLPKEPFRVRLQYRNLQQVYLRLVKMDEALSRKLEDRDEEAFWKSIASAESIRSWQQQLPDTRDLQEHAVEIKVDALPAGVYYLLASMEPGSAKKLSLLAARNFFVSSISYVHQQEKFFVLDRQSGQPLANAQAELYQKEYDYKTSRYTKKKLGTYNTDAQGFFIMSNKKDNRNNFLVDISYKGDRLNDDEEIYNYNPDYRDQENLPVKKTFFFTDRSIYRPGQTVYFKGIVVSADKNNNGVAAQYKMRVYLRNANDETEDSLDLTTNEYGSVSGKFQLPQGVLNGDFSISDKDQRSYISFSVEEYKRPKFSVSFEKINTSYRVNDTITLTGSAKAYAGNEVEGAKVSYRVVRQPRFLYDWLFGKWWQPQAEEMEIAHGETTTGKSGHFTIRFAAIPDRKIDPELDPVFDYHVYADVTDINGETRSGEKMVTAGYKSLRLQLEVDPRIPLDSGLRSLSIRTENMNGDFQRTNVHVIIYKQTPEDRMIRKRYWEPADQFVLSKEEYIRYFPHDEYFDETDPRTWPKTKAVELKDTTSEDGHFDVKTGQPLPAGFYAIEVVLIDQNGKETRDIRYVELYDPKTNVLAKPEYLWTKANDKPVEPGSSATVQLGSSATDVFLVKQVDKKKENPLVPIRRRTQPNPVPEEQEAFQFDRLNREKKSFTYSATENDRGGFGLSFFFVKDNRFYQFVQEIEVPWSNKDLKVEYVTFRDKTLPGAEEKWKVKISGNKNEKVVAEVLASMYDASLDQFRPHNWSKPALWPFYNHSLDWQEETNFQEVRSRNHETEVSYRLFEKRYDHLLWNMEYEIYSGFLKGRDMTQASKVFSAPQVEMVKGAPPVVQVGAARNPRNANRGDFFDVLSDTIIENKKSQPVDEVQVRKNLNETAFFFPDLKTDAEGNIEFSFTTPEALTRWKLQTLAHTKDLAFGMAAKEMVTQKQLMVQPNMPRFVRQGDHMELVAKIVNLTDKEMTGQAQLLLQDASTNESVDGWFINTFPNQYFTVAAGSSEVVKFPVQVPFQFNNAITWRIVARSGNYSDGEEAMLPVLTNKTLVTETITLPMRGDGTKNFRFEKLLNAGKSETLQHQSLTVEYTSNPVWYAVQALPYLMEYPYECSEQTWNRYYANALASHIVQHAPRIQQALEKWKTLDTAALLSNLQKNQELKSIMLEETPWVLQAKSEEQQKKNIALLFDMVKMNAERKASLQQLHALQSENGGFVWFKDGPDDRYITQYILTGMGHLKKVRGSSAEVEGFLTALPYLDKKIKEDYDLLVRSKAKLASQQIGYMQIQYLYMRSFFPETGMKKDVLTAYNYYKKQAGQFWMKQNPYLQGMIALALYRSGDRVVPEAILKSLKQTAIVNEELGMYWKDNHFGYGWFWWQAPIETQALLIEAFTEAGKDNTTADNLKTWLLKNKQTSNWRTTRATAEACYALLLKGSDWMKNEPQVSIQLGGTPLSLPPGETATGYVKQTIDVQKIKPAMGDISVTVQQAGSQPTWGAVYWQYFEDLDKITGAATPLQLEKKLFIRKNTDRGPQLTAITEGNELQVGDKVTVRIVLRVDRDMEYVHMKDMRAAALEPVNVLSGYRWQGGLGYYESTKDASTNFFFSNLRRGTYVFEYPLFVSHTGTFSNGITSIQCMYAPEFSAHSEGTKITVE